MRRVEKEAARKARAGKYVDPGLKRSAGGAAAAASRGVKKVRKGADAGRAGGHRTSLRRSTKIASLRAAEQREKREVTEMERRQRKKLREMEKPEIRVLSQKEMLEEARETEVRNGESLKELLRLEEEKKRVPVKKKGKGERMSVRSARDGETVSFTRKDADAKREMFGHLF